MIPEFFVLPISLHLDLTVKVTAGRIVVNRSQNPECVTEAYVT